EVELALLAEVVLRALLQLPQDERGNLRRRELAIVEADAHDAARLTTDSEWQQRRLVANGIDAAAHKSLDRVHAARRRREQPPLRLTSDEEGPVLAKRDYGR